MRKLIVNADDLGMSLNVTRGIVECHRNGIVTSASVMVNLPASSDSVRLVLEEAPLLGLGLHINLTTGSPLTNYTDMLLGAEGRFTGKAAFLPALTEEVIPAVIDEIHAQVDAFRNMVGQQPDHLDSHHHITYVHPDLTRTMLDIAHQLGIPVRRPFTDLPDSLESYLGKLNAQGDLPSTADTITEIMTASETAMPNYFSHSFFGDRTSLGDLLNDLVDVRDGVTELMCHPGIPDDDLRAVSGYVEPRQREMEALTHPTPREVLVANGVTLASFADLTP